MCLYHVIVEKHGINHRSLIFSTKEKVKTNSNIKSIVVWWVAVGLTQNHILTPQAMIRVKVTQCHVPLLSWWEIKKICCKMGLHTVMVLCNLLQNQKSCNKKCIVLVSRYLFDHFIYYYLAVVTGIFRLCAQMLLPQHTVSTAAMYLCKGFRQNMLPRFLVDTKWIYHTVDCQATCGQWPDCRVAV